MRHESVPEATAATAILDRLPRHSHVPTITGESHRLREQRRARALNAPAATVQAAA